MRRTIALITYILFTVISINAQEERGWQFGIKGNIPVLYVNSYITADATAGWRFDRIRYLGLGTGCHITEAYVDDDPWLSNGSVTSIPLYLDYIRYWPVGKTEVNSFFLGLEAGAQIYTDKIPRKDEKGRVAPHMSAKLGYDFAITSRLGLNIGTSFKVYEGACLGLDLGIRF